MKAIILGAGLGTRLAPYTDHTPKPLFPIDGRPAIDLIISGLERAGAKAVMINTHHLYKQIEDFVYQRKSSIPVYTRYEPHILETGGAVKNMEDFLDDSAFMIINSDIVTDIDFRAFYNFHLKNRCKVSMAVYDCPQINSVSVDKDGFITSFEAEARGPDIKKYTFTGIHVVEKEIVNLIPKNTFCSIKQVYKELIKSGENIKAFIADKNRWTDIGTPQRYRDAVFEKIAPRAFYIAFGKTTRDNSLSITKLKGDGSDRGWYRVSCGRDTMIMADHGIIKNINTTSEIDSFCKIGKLLFNNNINVPQIFFHDRFSGLAFLQDLGDMHLQDYVLDNSSLPQAQDRVTAMYEKVIDMLIKMSVHAGKKFNPLWAYQTPLYDKDFVMQYECLYFTNAFLKGYMGYDVSFDLLKKEFEVIAKNTDKFSIKGLMHRDFQSRNIMIKDNAPYFIDFQGARLGPIQYDLASLLFDPYTSLSAKVRDKLLLYSISRLFCLTNIDKESFKKSFKYFVIARSLQMLAAFGFLTKVKGKKGFEQYIKPALLNLKAQLIKSKDFPLLYDLVQKAYACL